MKVLSQEEQSRILDLEISVLGIRNFTLLRVFLWTGIRVAELAGLTYEDVYYQAEPKRLLLIRSNIAKGGKSREIPISEKLRNALRDYHRDRHLYTPGLADAPNSALFSQHRGTFACLSTRQIQRIIRILGDMARIPQLHPHTLRHTFATALLKQTNMRTIQAILGHSSLQSTQIYTHPNTNDMAEAVNKL